MNQKYDETSYESPPSTRGKCSRKPLVSGGGLNARKKTKKLKIHMNNLIIFFIPEMITT